MWLQKDLTLTLSQKERELKISCFQRKTALSGKLSRVLEKDRGNRCEYFRFKDSQPGATSEKSKAHKLADQLFKK